MSVTREQVIEILRQQNELNKRELNAQLDEVMQTLRRLEPPSAESYIPVEINPTVVGGNTNMDLIKSIQEFKGDTASYPAWRSAAEFAIGYYKEGSEQYYVAMGIFRNKIVGPANATLASFSTVLNFKAIIARLDKAYADKRPLHVLETELSVLRQGSLSICQYYDTVDKQLTLITNKNIMTHSNNTQLAAALNDRARENALRVFISGLKRPLCDILFSANPKDLPSALATAQELANNRMRYDFARTFAVNNVATTTSPKYHNNYPGNPQMLKDTPTPMDVDRGSSAFRRTKQSNQSYRKGNAVGGHPKRDANQYVNKREHRRGDSVNSRKPKVQRTNHLETTPEADPQKKITVDRDSDSDVEIASNFAMEDEVNFLV